MEFHSFLFGKGVVHMEKHICRYCGKTYSYCRGCLLSPISYKENGYCSKECRESAKNQKEIVQRDVEVVVNDEDTTIS